MKHIMGSSGSVDFLKRFVHDNFERLLVLVLVASMVGIHWFIDDKIAFLNFYYLPVIVAGFQTGRRGATVSSLFIVTLVGFFQAVVGLDGRPGGSDVLLTLVPWGGFLILTAYTVGSLADQRRQRLSEVKQAYMTVLELLTFHIEAAEQHTRGHSYRVAARAVAIAHQFQLSSDERESLRVAGLLHELKNDDPRIARLFKHFPGETRAVPVLESMRTALDIVGEYSRYYELAGRDWPADHLRIRLGTKILAVADAFETLQLPSQTRAPLSVWGALEEIERGQGSTFATNVVRALRSSVTPERTVEIPNLAAI